MRRNRQVAVLVAVLVATGGLEGWEGRRQKLRGVDPTQDRHPTSFRLLALTGWPAGLLAIATTFLPPHTGRRIQAVTFWAGLAATGSGVALRQWSIHTLGRQFVGYVTIQPDHQLVRSGPYRWLRHPSYTGLWLELAGIGLATGNAAGLATSAAVPLIGIVSRIRAEEDALRTAFPEAYPAYARRTKRMFPFLW